jgi:hypothetical protein
LDAGTGWYFRHKGLKLFFELNTPRSWGRMLRRLNVATDAQAMNLPGWTLHQGYH